MNGINYSISINHAMHAFISARQRTCPARMGFWVSFYGYLPSYVFVTVQALVLYLYSTSIYPPSVESFPARGSGCRQDYHPSQSCHPTSVMQHLPSAATQIIGFSTIHPSCSPLLAPACIHQNSCAQFCHGYYIAFDYHDRSRSLNHF